jgi:hypothetical protein
MMPAKNLLPICHPGRSFHNPKEPEAQTTRTWEKVFTYSMESLVSDRCLLHFPSHIYPTCVPNLARSGHWQPQHVQKEWMWPHVYASWRESMVLDSSSWVISSASTSMYVYPRYSHSSSSRCAAVLKPAIHRIPPLTSSTSSTRSKPSTQTLFSTTAKSSPYNTTLPPTPPLHSPSSILSCGP